MARLSEFLMSLYISVLWTTPQIAATMPLDNENQYSGCVSQSSEDKSK